MRTNTTNAFNRIAIAATLVFAAVHANADEVLFNWEKSGDTMGWKVPNEQYRKEFGMAVAIEQSADKAFQDKGSLKMKLDGTAIPSKRARAERYYGGTADWSTYRKVTVMCLTPADGPALSAMLVVQAGANWKWQQGATVQCKPGEWTKVELDLTEIEGAGNIQQAYVIIDSATTDLKGEAFVDKFTLEGAIERAPTVPGAEATSDKGSWIETFDNENAKWEKQGNARATPAETAAIGTGASTFFLPGFISKATTPPTPINPDVLDEGYKGISFWVRGDGSDQFGTFVLCGLHPQWFPFKYAYSFPLKDTEWKKYTVAWRDLIPEDDVYPMGQVGGAAPSNIQFIKVGNKWDTYFNNAKLPRFSFSLDQVQLETEVPAAPQVPELAKIDSVRAKLAAKEPVNILCLGDSITAGTSLGKADQERYAQVLERMLREKTGADNITVTSRAVGGAQINDLRLWAPRDFTGIPTPDLVIVMVGYNDKTWGYPASFFSFAMNDYIDRVALRTEGKAAVIVMPPIPGKGPRFVMMDDFADAIRNLAKERADISLCDMNATFKALGREGLNAYMADMAHPNAKGHELMAETIASFLDGGK